LYAGTTSEYVGTRLFTPFSAPVGQSRDVIGLRPEPLDPTALGGPGETEPSAAGLTWADIDYEAELIRVHRQLSREREHAPLRTEAGKREVILAPKLAKSLRERWLASRFKAPHDFVFCNTLEHGLDYRDVYEAFRQAVKRAGLQAPYKLTLHSLRHGFASLRIANGLNVVYVSRQLGHANRSSTLEIYAHLFERAPTTPRRRATANSETIEGWWSSATAAGSRSTY
jgi:integrase